MKGNDTLKATNLNNVLVLKNGETEVQLLMIAARKEPDFHEIKNLHVQT